MPNMWSEFVVLFGIMACGYFAAKKNWLDRYSNMKLGSLIIHIAIPAILFSSIAGVAISKELMGEFVLVTFISIGEFAFLIILSGFLGRLFKLDIKARSVFKLTMGTSNNGFMGFPIIISFFGQLGLFYMIANNLALSVIVWGYGVNLLKKQKDGETNVKKSSKLAAMLKSVVSGTINTNVIAILLGLGVNIMGITPHISGTGLYAMVERLGAIAIPLSMIYIGATLAEHDIHEVIKEKTVVIGSIVRMTVLVFLLYIIIIFLPLSEIIRQVLVVAVALPAAAIVPVMAGEYGGDSDLSAKIVFFTTLISVITLPLWMIAVLNFI